MVSTQTILLAHIKTDQWSLCLPHQYRQSYLLTSKLTSGLYAYPTNTDNLTCSHQNWPVVCMLTPPIQTILLAHIKTDQWSVCLPHQYRQSYLLTSKLTSGLYACPHQYRQSYLLTSKLTSGLYAYPHQYRQSYLLTSASGTSLHVIIHAWQKLSCCPFHVRELDHAYWSIYIYYNGENNWGTSYFIPQTNSLFSFLP